MKFYTWPDGVATAVGVSTESLQQRRAIGDAPRLFAVTERRLVTTEEALTEWIAAKEVPSNYKCRAPTRRGGFNG